MSLLGHWFVESSKFVEERDAIRGVTENRHPVQSARGNKMKRTGKIEVRPLFGHGVGVSKRRGQAHLPYLEISLKF